MIGRLSVPPCQATGPSGRGCLYCYANGRKRSNYRGHFGFRPANPIPKAKWTDYMKSPGKPDPSGKYKWTCPDAEFFKALPLLAEGMCDAMWDTGKPREPWTLKCRFDADSVVITLNDPGLKLVCFTSAPSLWGGLELIEAALVAGTLSWKKSKF